MRIPQEAYRCVARTFLSASRRVATPCEGKVPSPFDFAQGRLAGKVPALQRLGQF